MKTIAAVFKVVMGGTLGYVIAVVLYSDGVSPFIFLPLALVAAFAVGFIPMFGT